MEKERKNLEMFEKNQLSFYFLSKIIGGSGSGQQQPRTVITGSKKDKTGGGGNTEKTN
jgi:hypothetical protein